MRLKETSPPAKSPENEALSVMKPMRICFWSTTFQADNHAFADHLVKQGHEVVVAMSAPEKFLREPVSSLVPFAGTLLDRESATIKKDLLSRSFDAVVVDNHLPTFEIAPSMYVLWHGFGWRIDDLSTMRKELKKLIGDVQRPNPHFVWQAFGDWDREYRIRHSLLHEDNVVALGSPYSDWLRPQNASFAGFDKSAVQAHYQVDLKKPVVLLALTWHHGGSLGHWGDEEALLLKLFDHIASRDASVIMRMHDRQRYQPDYVALVERLARRADGRVMLKWKSEAPDSLLDMRVSNVCISNYSSLLNAFYYTEKPTIHIDPHDAEASEHVTFTMFLGRPMPRSVSSKDDLWKLPPNEIGGLRAQSFQGLLAAIDEALADPTCCEARSRAFIANYITSVDGHAAERSEARLRELVEA